MNDIKYEIWLPSTMDYFKSLSHFLLAPCSTLTATGEDVYPAAVELKTFVSGDQQYWSRNVEDLSQVDC